MSEKDEQVVSQTPKKKTHTGKKKRGRFGMAVRKAIKTIVIVAILCGAGLFGLKAYINKQAESSSTTSYSRAVVTRGALEETVYGSDQRTGGSGRHADRSARQRGRCGQGGRYPRRDDQYRP